MQDRNAGVGNGNCSADLWEALTDLLCNKRRIRLAGIGNGNGYCGADWCEAMVSVPHIALYGTPPGGAAGPCSAWPGTRALPQPDHL